MMPNVSALWISILRHQTTKNPEPGRRIWERGDLKIQFLATKNTLKEPLRLWTDTLMVWVATCKGLLSQHFICTNFLQLNSCMQKGLEFEGANTWVGKGCYQKKLQPKGRQFTVHERYQWGGKIHWIDFFKSIVVKKKKFSDLLAKWEKYCAMKKYSRGCCRNIPDPGQRQDYRSFTSQNPWILCYNTSSCLLSAELHPAPQILAAGS